MDSYVSYMWLNIFTFRTPRLYIYIFVCTELIEETTILTGLIFGKRGIFGSGSDSSSFERKFTHTMEL